MIPGGLVVTEGGIIGLLELFGVKLNQAATVTLVVRLCTLWFAVFLGAVFLFLMERRLPWKRGKLACEGRQSVSPGLRD